MSGAIPYCKLSSISARHSRALRARRHGDARLGAVDAGHFERAAERGARHADRHAAVNVGAVALKQAMGRAKLLAQQMT